MTELSYKSFGITLRPPHGVTAVHEARVVKHILKNCDYYHVVSEKEGDDRHLHMVLMYKDAKKKSDVCKLVNRWGSLDEPNSKRYGKCVKIAYNCEWVQKYCLDNPLKEGEVRSEVCKQLPAGHIESYFPTESEQQLAQSKAKPSCFARMREYESLWYEHMPQGTELCRENVDWFLSKVWYNLRIMKGPLDGRHQKSVCMYLLRWMRRCDAPTMEWAPFEPLN